MGISPTCVDKPDNLIWIEQVILNNLESTPMEQTEFPISASNGSMVLHPNPSNTSRAMINVQQKHSSNVYNTAINTRPQHDIKLMIAEIEMRDENYFGDDRINTLSRLVAARIKYLVEGEEEERSHFWIIKIPSILPAERELSRMFDVYRREICFYTEVLPAMKMWVDSQYIDQLLEFRVPSCYYGKFLRPSDKNPDMELLDHILEAESLLVLEDLRAAEYGKRYFGKGMEISELFAAVNEISKFHAVSYAMQIKEKEPLHWKELLHWTDQAALYEMTFHRGFEVFKNFLSNRPEEPEADKMLQAMTHLNNKIRHVLNGLLCPSNDFPSTLVHMDFWSDNLLFRIKDPDENVPLEEADLDCVIIDWQMMSLGRPTHDLALITILSMDSESRRDISHLILQYYYQLFEQTIGWFDLEMPFTFEQLILEFSNSCLLAVIMAISSMDLVLLQENAQVRLLNAIYDLIEDGILSPE